MEHVRVRDIMPHGTLVKVHEDTPIGQLDKILAEAGISGVPVVTSTGDLVGHVSKTDIIRLIADSLRPGDGFFEAPISYEARVSDLVESLKTRKVKDIMSRQVHSIGPDIDIRSAANAMIRRRHHRLPVVERGKLIGIISSFDLLKAIAFPFERI
ncbi:MAG TPA: CBS domain-containing protein [Planctomycetota bacterium]|nr:CBS domain-containing protein [Planctomycetota bacterium]